MPSEIEVNVYDVYVARDDGRGIWDATLPKGQRHVSYDDTGTDVYIRAFWTVVSDSSPTADVSAEIYVGNDTAWESQSPQRYTAYSPDGWYYGETGWCTSDAAEPFVFLEKNTYQGTIEIVINTQTHHYGYFEVEPAFRTLDIKTGGTGVALGAYATVDDALDVGYDKTIIRSQTVIYGDVDLNTAPGWFADGSYYLPLGGNDGISRYGLAHLFKETGNRAFVLDLHDEYNEPTRRFYWSASGSFATQEADPVSGYWGTDVYFTRVSGFVTDTSTASTGNISAGGTKWVTVNCAKSGYTLLAPVGYYFNGTGSGVTVAYALRKSSATECQAALKNNGTATANFTLEIQCLYVRNSG